MRKLEKLKGSQTNQVGFCSKTSSKFDLAES